MKGILVLEDGSAWPGRAVGARRSVGGEVVFNTGMTGYQEILTDPSYAGQLVVMTYPLIGNYGVTAADLESEKPTAPGFIVREFCDEPNNWRMQEGIIEYLRQAGVVALEGVDTRALTRHLRRHGTMRGYIGVGDDVDQDRLQALALAEPPLSQKDLVRTVTTPKPYTVGEGDLRVAVLDLGCKQHIPLTLARRGCRVTVFPAWSSAAEILSSDPRGIVLSNGPGDPTASSYVVDTVRELVDCGRPVFGVCMGHQMLALALGATTFKLQHGHRGANHPVKDLATGRVYITSQNHGYAVSDQDLPRELEITHVHLNDGTIEGLCHKHRPVHSVQYYPEGVPGPRDSQYLFDEFVQKLREV